VKTLDDLMSTARSITNRVAKKADAVVYGTPRARNVFESMNPAQREAMAETVRDQYGDGAWADFETVVGRAHGKEA